MAVKRFLLDTSQLNDATFGLDGGLAFILDSSQLDGTRVLDGGEFLTTATGAATLGGMSATGSATVIHFASASAPLGELIAETANITVTVTAEGSAPLGAMTATASTSVVISASASAPLGALTATANSSPTILPIFQANLGGLVASADATVIPPTPPEPEPTPSGGRQYAAPRRKKIEPVPEPVSVEIPVIQPKRRYAVVSTSLNGMKAQATSTITFSILEDDAEVLLLV
jgi:hypothetical protein